MSKATEPQQTPYLLPQGAYPVYMPNADDEIDLFELMATLWKKKGIIVLVTFLTTALAAGYAFTAKEQWTSEAIVTVPSAAAVSNLYAGYRLLSQEDKDKVVPISDIQNSVFNRFLDDSASYDNLARYLAGTDYFKALVSGKTEKEKMQILDNWIKQITIQPVDKNVADKVRVALPADNSSQAQQLLRQYLVQSSQQAVQQSYADLEQQIKAQKASLADAMMASRTVAEVKRQTEIADIESALLIAEQAGITKPELSSGMELKPNNLFLLGSKPLSAMLQGIKKQPLVMGDKYYEQQTNLFSLEKYQPNSEQVSAFSYLKAASEPVTKDKPKKTLILVLGALLGGMLGVAVVLVHSLIINRKEPQ
ncbi:LPS O-antigen chain length determinant protein WzzB [Plesiomonas shigelloides]|uniref:LPS O-antigen chain length determinant protein WzzB n=1 Tax=Plesiomonas shigelloides TaxID=703 RepID=UPI002245BE3C|nr:Wzz/FepE/Etk N-terminal domain-containing protein [Plesiomonas shigelloides]MCX2497640.1 Wzz/FepE/Etk N-terminal domain-containing protein [Plesiomonas shigelloides]